MPTPTDDKESIHANYVSSLFLLSNPELEVAAPVVILQNDAANVYAVLENHFIPMYLPQPDKFWKIVRQILNVETWRPRVYGAQLKVCN